MNTVNKLSTIDNGLNCVQIVETFILDNSMPIHDIIYPSDKRLPKGKRK